MRRLCIFLLLATASLLIPALPNVRAATIDDVILHYKFDDVSGAAFADSGINGNHATLYRFLTYAELPAIDASHAMGGLGSPFDGALFVGTRNISDVSHELMIDVPASTALPGTGDNFAVSFWLRVANWSTSWGIVGAYKLNGLDWVIGTHNTAKGLMITSGDANASGDPVYSVDCVAAGLLDNEFAHFVVQFEGTAGITGVYVDGISKADSNTTAIPWWGNEDEGFVLGGRVLSARTFSGVDAVLDDFAIIPGVVNQTQVESMRTLGVAGSGVTTSMHYTLDEETGSTIGDSSG
ncbi:MAG TPA: hypothetical protein DD670_05730, partial [Planctomycetaceae bacterium]|nr:hypothetical protein [Planctomycetaceae bacterium]